MACVFATYTMITSCKTVVSCYYSVFCQLSATSYLVFHRNRFPRHYARRSIPLRRAIISVHICSHLHLMHEAIVIFSTQFVELGEDTAI